MSLRVFLCGDVMTGRGIDQALPHPVDPVLYEPYVRDAGEYVELAEKAHGAFQRPVTFNYIWGEAAQELDRVHVDLRIINLETAITSAETQWPGKGIHYRMHPLNIGCLSAARISGCALANNHVLDWGYEGLSDTLRSLDAAGVAHAGAGRNAEEAAAPAVLNVPGKGRVLLFSFGSAISGYEKFLGDLALMYLVELHSRSGELMSVRLVPMRMRRFRLEHASAADANLLCDLLNRLGAPFGTEVQLANEKGITLKCPHHRRKHKSPKFFANET